VETGVFQLSLVM